MLTPKTDKDGLTGPIIIRRVPVDLRREFKILCIRESKTVQDKIIELMHAAVMSAW